jgi:hypothetical protein
MDTEFLVAFDGTTAKLSRFLQCDPDEIRRKYLGLVNEKPWFDEGAEKWLCTLVAANTDIPSSPTKWQVNFAFQRNPDGWNREIVFVDPRTGQPPPDLVDGVGRKKLIMYRRADFNELF